MKLIYFISFLSFNCFFIFLSGQESTQDPFEIYQQDKNNKILIIPFESKMYASSVDAAIATKSELKYHEIKEEFRRGMSEQILLSISNKIPAISMIHHIDTNANILNHIYNSIGYKYDIVKEKEIEESPATKSEQIKKEILKLSDKIHHNQEPKEKSTYERGKISNGEVYTSYHNAERFMNTTIHNPDLLNELHRTYQTNHYIFINEFHISRPRSKPEDPYEQYRQIKVHYSVFNQKGKQVDAGTASAEMPKNIYDLRKIKRNYFSLIAQEICAFIPDPQLEKETIEKEGDDRKKAKGQRKIIHGLLVE